MKLCPTCGQNITMFGNKIVHCALCRSEFCTGCETNFRKEPREPHGFPLCRKCYKELESDEILGLEITCPNCSKEYFIREYHELKCRCGLLLHTISGKVIKTMVLSCPNCEQEVDPFEERLLSCSLCGEMFCTHCQRTFRSESRGEGLFPLCKGCYESRGYHTTVMLTITCENCNDEFRFYDPSKIACLHGEEVRLSDPFPVRCKCGKLHDSAEGIFRKVKLYVDANQQVKVQVLKDQKDTEEELMKKDADGEDELIGDGNEDGEELIEDDEDGAESISKVRGVGEDLIEDNRETIEELIKDDGEELVEDPPELEDEEAECETCGSKVTMSSVKCPVCGTEFA